MAYLTILLAFIIGFYFGIHYGNREQYKKDIEAVKSATDNLFKDNTIKIIRKKEPKTEEEENLEIIEKRLKSQE